MPEKIPLLSATRQQRVVRAGLLVLAGAAQTLSFSPWEFWPAGLASLIIILLLCLSRPAPELFRSGWLVGLGLFGSGASWVYVSIHDYGMTSAPLAAIMTLTFVAGLALFPALAFWCWGKLAGNQRWRQLCLFPALWVLGDWLRGWVLTGFPWLFLGTSQVDGPLSGWAPILGVHGVTLIIAATAVLALATTETWLRGKQRLAALMAGLMLLPWLIGPALDRIDWTTPDGTTLTVAAMQGNIPQQIKWDPDFMRAQLNTYLEMTEDDWGRDLILWPETAIPMPHTQATEVLKFIDEQGDAHNSALLTGIPWYGYSERHQTHTFHNSIMALGASHGTYHKQRLVPFGEYVPLEQWLRGAIDFFNLPMSSFRRGPSHQEPLRVSGVPVHPFICYEIAYADFVARHASHTGILITISNDAWFGRSIGPLQHLQIARMRALETRRFMLRGTNNGVTAVVDERGQVVHQIPRFERAVLRGELYPAYGTTPFMATGSWPVLTLAAVLIVFIRQRKDARESTT